MADDARAQWEEVGRLLDVGDEDKAVVLARQLVQEGHTKEPAALPVLLRLSDVLKRAGIVYTPAPPAGSEPMLPPSYPLAADGEVDDT